MLNQKRRHFWIDPPLQLQILATFMVLEIGSLFLLAYSVFHGLEEASLSTHQIFHSLDWVETTLRGPMIISAATAMLASALIALVWSHRFAGPLRVLCSAIARLGQGNFSVPVRIRKFDTHQELVHEFAQMQERLRERLGADLRSLESAASRIKAALAQLPNGHDAHREAKAALAELESISSHYRL